MLLHVCSYRRDPLPAAHEVFVSVTRLDQQDGTLLGALEESRCQEGLCRKFWVDFKRDKHVGCLPQASIFPEAPLYFS